MSFEKFERGGGRSIGNAVSINKCGQLTLTANFKKHFEGHNFCELYFDKEKQLIGVKALKETTQSSRRIRSWTGDGRGNFISMTGFLRFHGISFKEKRIIYPAIWDEDSNMLVVNVASDDPDIPAAA